MQEKEETKEQEGSSEPDSKAGQEPESAKKEVPSSPGKTPDKGSDYDSIVDVSGKSLDFPVLLEEKDGGDCKNEAVEGLYMYKNVFNLIPTVVGGMKRLKTLKFFGNEVNLFPGEGDLFRDLVELESLQVKMAASPGLSGLDMRKLKGLKELELSRVPIRPSAFPVLTEIAGLKCLTKLSICHFSIRFLPPEIGSLKKLEYLDLSFNKMKNLPAEITYLNSLISLRVSNNKLIELPPGLSCLQRLENLDLSKNRLTSLGSLELGSMHNLQRLNLQYNRLPSCCQIPSWICCDFEGNGTEMCNDELISYSVEMDVLEGVQEIHGSHQNGSSSQSSSHLAGPNPNNKCFAARRSKGWKRRYYLQQRARQERLNNSRKWKGENRPGLREALEKCVACKNSDMKDASSFEGSSLVMVAQISDTKSPSGAVECVNSVVTFENDINSRKSSCSQKCSCVGFDPDGIHEESDSGCHEPDVQLAVVSDASSLQSESTLSEVSKCVVKSKRHFDWDFDNPKPSKSRRPAEGHSGLSCKYSRLSFCGIDDHLPDGFYDAGRDRPFMPLPKYEESLHLTSREVILVDRERDEGLDAIALCAQAFVLQFKQLRSSIKESGNVANDSLQIASLLALFVSDHFGGSDRSKFIQRTRKAVSGSNYRKPFVCTCQTGNDKFVNESTKRIPESVEDVVFLDLCERSLQSIKVRNKSIVVPIGSLNFGVCRHRALLLKYLCDRMEPRIPCELVRGYMDFSPHAWNVIAVKNGKSWVRMIVDACHPHDIREETDPEYFCRYVPLSRVNIPPEIDGNSWARSSFPSLSSHNEIGKAVLTKLVPCKVGSLDAVAKVRTLEVCGTSADEIRNFELSCLGEVRILGILKHSCIVEFYGHQLLSKWVTSSDGKEHRVLESAILMEYIKGGSLKNYIEKLSIAGEKHVPAKLALFIARDVACSLALLHSRHIIHRDIKSENVLIDLDDDRADGIPVVKLCDFDRAVPLRSQLHTCCIAHFGIPPPDVCVGTPRWMAPEVFLAMHERNVYGLEVDIWSFGCLLLELLTLQVPYSELSDSDIHDFLQMGKRPELTEDLRAFLESGGELEANESSPRLKGLDTEIDTVRFLVTMYHRCTEKNPTDRPTAEELYSLLLAQTNAINGSKSSEQE